MTWIYMEPFVVCGWTIRQHRNGFVRSAGSVRVKHIYLFDAIISAQRSPYSGDARRPGKEEEKV